MKKNKYEKPLLIKEKIKINFFQFRVNKNLLAAIECGSGTGNCFCSYCCGKTCMCSC